MNKVELSQEILDKIRAEARARVEKELRVRAEAETKSAAAAELAAETQRLRREVGLASHLDDLVEVTLNLPPFAKSLVFDGVEYFHGYTYTVTRAIYDVMREQVARGWDAERRAGNPNLKFYDQRFTGTMNPYLEAKIAPGGWAIHRETELNGVTGIVKNAPRDLVEAGGL